MANPAIPTPLELIRSLRGRAGANRAIPPAL